LADILTFDGKDFKVDRRTLVPLVDKPISGAGDVESATQRRVRLKKWVQAAKDKGNEAFLKTVAEAEGISVARLKQLVYPKPNASKLKFRRSAY
jgi:hypothetical protein